MTSPQLTIATLLPHGIESAFAAALPTAEFIPLTSDALGSVPAEAQILIAGPIRGTDRHQVRPSGWPFGLRWVHLISAGLDTYPEWLFERVTVSYSPGLSAAPLAEYALAAILAASKNLPALWVSAAEQWRFSFVNQVAGATLGIVGFGAIGAALASRALALGMNVQALRRSAAPLPDGVTRATSLGALLATSDHVVLAAPATPETLRMIDRSSLAAAKRGLHLINIARGSLIDDDALLEALADGRVGRATLDTTLPEPLPAGHPFYTHPQVFVSPHCGGAAKDGLAKLVDVFVENVRLFAAGEMPRHVIDRDRGY